ncbi:MAG: hypothetical protein KAY46_26200, partial [Burkholderiaceae bacterium]|nr:hypothetical protein [Burkholderiaceae bacterium]
MRGPCDASAVRLINLMADLPCSRSPASRHEVRAPAKCGQRTHARPGPPGPHPFPELPMSVQDLTAQEFDSTVTANDIVVVDFWAPWCG